MRRVLTLGVLTVIATGAIVVGVRLAGAVDEVAGAVATIGAPQAEPYGDETFSAPASLLEARAVEPPETAPSPSAGDAASDDGPSIFEEDELALEYFGDGVSLNDLGQLQSPDPEFDRAMRALANEHGEIEARD